MGTLYLVRHGQASFGADNYDQLSPLGEQQSQRLGEYLRQRGHQFDTVITGTLQRHLQTHDALARGLQVQHEPLRRPGLNEYDSHALIAAVHPEPLQRPDSPESYRNHFRLLRDGLKRWMDGRSEPAGMPTYREFANGVAGVLDEVREQDDARVLLVSSGGPIATAMGLILGLAPEVTIDLNMRLRNSSITEFAYTPKRHMLVTYNTLPHLDGDDYKDWVSYA
ncbi:MAG: histidine phosphatase family protein [Ideonella sp.]|nr:histidine phosphatase family protein [Ideonella sp.]